MDEIFLESYLFFAGVLTFEYLCLEIAYYFITKNVNI